MKLTLRKSEVLDNWYVICRAQHSGRFWVEQISPGISQVRLSERFSDADVEGSAEEMRQIAQAIKRRGSVSFKRCAVEVCTELGHVSFWSPRNSQLDGRVSLDEADALADELLTKLEFCDD